MDLMREDDGTRVARKWPRRREVPDSFEGTILINEIVLAIYGEVKLSLHLLHHISVQWVRAGGGAPKAEGIILNRRELGCAKKAGGVEHLTNGTNRTSGSTPLQLPAKILSGGTHSKVLPALQV